MKRSNIVNADRKTWTTEHFARANPFGPGMDSVPQLLRAVAESIESLGDIVVHDLLMHTTVEAEGYWHSITAYFSRDPADIAASRWNDGTEAPDGVHDDEDGS